MNTATQSENTVVFDIPVQRGDQVIESVELRKPNAGALRGTNLADLLQMNVDALVRVVPRVSTPALHETEVMKLDPADLVKLGAKVAGFLLPREAAE